ncbi:hypothetical protein GWA01_05080 [Gluconobacter wancherniae NBRC 103581]|uniref:Uncharacterized protein n=1 Tax=Gluconobacter wancherniae NBRC 103581 TaxID=656744 RepID=A0A511AX04_9PROT|nr:hypothetical protein AA103581_0945 [Gluconobacter wancherniae NBRC 103581]GEK92738.1 hypothetical protein GWA01_05080 [Gluconobacter wancherniae NBRC 103581]
MLNLFLILLVIIIWPSIFYLHYQEAINRWFMNRFGRDSMPLSHKSVPGAPLPFSYDPPKEEEKTPET